MVDTVKILRLTLAFCAIGSLAACGEEPRPPSVAEFIEDPILLDATMVRCIANRNSAKYEAECVNAREAVERMAAAKQNARRDELEAESARKRDALRQAHEAADQRRRQAAEAERLREEAEYLGLAPALLEDGAAGDQEPSSTDLEGNQPGVTVTVQDAPISPTSTGPEDTALPGGEPEAAPGEEVAPPVTTDLGEIREQLEQRQPTSPPESSP